MRSRLKVKNSSVPLDNQSRHTNDRAQQKLLKYARILKIWTIDEIQLGKTFFLLEPHLQHPASMTDSITKVDTAHARQESGGKEKVCRKSLVCMWRH